ncbi:MULTISPECIES: hypothetical protein [unclassified Stenotrophomonas]|uniref:hypothetical protein n=1 Tax=unclassified Stenotrophomonas TaxID=196198 RepID=UPI0025D15F40|nr:MULTISPECIES: hypothetical protein [unclassified Stenotrophomonas]
MTDVRELLARLNPTTIRMDIGTGSGGGVDALTNIDIAGALGMVPAGLGRDLLELLHGPNPSRADIFRSFEGAVRVAMEERARRLNEYFDAKTTLGIADCIAKFHRDRSEAGRRNIGILRARVSVAHDRLFPDRLEERLPDITAVCIGHMRGERLSNRERAAAIGVSDSSYREAWAGVVDWLLARLVEAEQQAACRLRKAVDPNTALS